MKAMALQWIVSPAIGLQRLVRYGLLAALAFALAASAQLFDASRECRGDFSSAFRIGFDLYRCELTVKAVGSDLRFSIPLPRSSQIPRSGELLH
jgi:hypothetical protein